MKSSYTRSGTGYRALTLFTCAAAAFTSVASLADQPHDGESNWKLTIGEYVYAPYSGVDANVRWRGHDSDAWIGIYHDPEFGTQSRAGGDTTINVAKYVQLQPSLQLATMGFVGGSLNVQVGDAWYLFGGLGRTNLKPYFNLNFDPNDAVTYGFGHRTDIGRIYTMFVVADNRLGTHQQDWHLNVRVPINTARATLDVLYKQGLSDAGRIAAWGFSGTWDWPRWFVRLAYDPYQNFSALNAWRFAAGLRF